MFVFFVLAAIISGMLAEENLLLSKWGILCMVSTIMMLILLAVHVGGGRSMVAPFSHRWGKTVLDHKNAPIDFLRIY
jgi:hypothetical protein